jgi:hypothetical protein
MTPESRNSGARAGVHCQPTDRQTRVPAATNRRGIGPLLGNGSVTRPRCNEQTPKSTASQRLAKQIPVAKDKTE